MRNGAETPRILLDQISPLNNPKFQSHMNKTNVEHGHRVAGIENKLANRLNESFEDLYTDKSIEYLLSGQTGYQESVDPACIVPELKQNKTDKISNILLNHRETSSDSFNSELFLARSRNRKRSSINLPNLVARSLDTRTFDEVKYLPSELDRTVATQRTTAMGTAIPKVSKQRRNVATKLHRNGVESIEL